MKRKILATLIIGMGVSLVGCGNSTNSNMKNQLAPNITIEQAKEIALKHSNLTSDEVSFIKAEKDMDNGIEKYDIEFYYNNKEYDYEINAANGEIINYDYDVENYNISGQQQSNTQEQSNNQQQQDIHQPINTSNISIDKAKEIALNHAGLAANQVSFIKAEKDMDDGIEKYDIEFYHNNKEYDYEINAVNGQIISYDHDVENYNIQSPQQSNSQPQNNQQQTNTSNISVDKAKEIALNHAGLAANQVSFIKAEKDMDDGIEKYDIEFYHNNKEYDYEINAVNGQIISYDHDVENYNIQSPQQSNSQPQNNQQQTNTSNISVDKAKEIALNHAGLAANQVSFVKAEKDMDDGIVKYDIEFYYNNREYNYEINANNGSIMSYEQD